MAGMHGVRDVPIGKLDEDILDLRRYAQALARFVQQCDTPMTVGIQGDWGSGKTSLMQLIQGLLQQESAPPETHTLNTWQYAQVAEGRALSLVVIQALHDKLAEDKTEARKVIGGLWKAVRALRKVEFGGFGVEVDPTKDEATETFDVQKLKDDFARLVASRCQKTRRDRLVVFVDDLDRVLPERAVEILEALKNFVDVPGCVFVIACDYEVVRKGLKAKFKVGEKELQGRSFFDKIIQVPFRMPVHGYDVNRFVQHTLAQIGWTCSDEDAKDYRGLLENSIGFNPRSIKRLCNTLLLLKAVASGGQDGQERALLDDPVRMKILFGLVCLEAAHEKAHAALVRDPATLGPLLLDPEARLAEALGEALVPLQEPARSRLVSLLELLGKIIDTNRDRQIDDEERERLAEMVGLSAITSVGGDDRAPRAARRTVDEILELAAAHRVRSLVEPLRGWLLKRIEAGSRLREQTSRTTLSYFAPKQLWGEKSGSNCVLQCPVDPRDGVLRLQLELDRFERMNAGKPEGWAALQSYLAAHPTDPGLRWGPTWRVVELGTPAAVDEFLGVLGRLVPLA